MPAVVSHYIMSERLIDDIHEFYPSLKLNRTAFIWGGNGPDFFFCHRIMPWQRGKSYNKIGTLMHKMPAENILGYLVAYAKTTKAIPLSAMPSDLFHTMLLIVPLTHIYYVVPQSLQNLK